MVTARTRPGHSLPELIVAVTFLGASLCAVGATAALGAGWTSRAVMRQDAVRAAAATLDSLLAAPAVAHGQRTLGPVSLRWTTSDAPAGLEVEVTAAGPDGRELARLAAPWTPAAPLLPWPDAPAP